jgi:hypothetical protein
MSMLPTAIYDTVVLEQFAAAYAHKSEPEGRAVVIEPDEMWHYLKN